jgi:hypothetical protein
LRVASSNGAFPTPLSPWLSLGEIICPVIWNAQ